MESASPGRGREGSGPHDATAVRSVAGKGLHPPAGRHRAAPRRRGVARGGRDDQRLRAGLGQRRAAALRQRHGDEPEARDVHQPVGLLRPRGPARRIVHRHAELPGIPAGVAQPHARPGAGADPQPRASDGPGAARRGRGPAGAERALDRAEQDDAADPPAHFAAEHRRSGPLPGRAVAARREHALRLLGRPLRARRQSRPEPDPARRHRRVQPEPPVRLLQHLRRRRLEDGGPAEVRVPRAVRRPPSSLLDVHNREGNRKRLAGVARTGLIASSATLEGPWPKGSWMLSGRHTHIAAPGARGQDRPAVRLLRRAGQGQLRRHCERPCQPELLLGPRQAGLGRAGAAPAPRLGQRDLELPVDPRAEPALLLALRPRPQPLRLARGPSPSRTSASR